MNLADNSVNQSAVVDFLKSITLFHSLDEEQLRKLARTLQVRQFRQNEVIVRQGEAAHAFFIVADGAVAVYKRPATRASSAVHAPAGRGATAGAGAGAGAGVGASSELGPMVAALKVGHCFGERALIKSEPRAATCVALSQVTCLAMDRTVFTDVLSDLDNLLGTYTDSIYESTDATVALTRHVTTFNQLAGAARELAAEIAVEESDPAVVDAAAYARVLLDVLAAASAELGVAELLQRMFSKAATYLACEAMMMFDVAGGGVDNHGNRRLLCAGTRVVRSGRSSVHAYAARNRSRSTTQQSRYLPWEGIIGECLDTTEPAVVNK